MQGGDRDRVTETEAVELERLEIATRIVELVRQYEHRATRQAQYLRELLVPGRHACDCVDDEEDEIRLLDRFSRLRGDLGAEWPSVCPIDAAGVDEPEGRARPLAQQLLAVARDAWRLMDDGRAGRRQPVDQGRLADIREADDRNRAGDLDVGSDLAHCGGVASRGRPSSCTPASHSQSFLISRSSSTDASL